MSWQVHIELNGVNAWMHGCRIGECILFILGECTEQASYAYWALGAMEL